MAHTIQQQGGELMCIKCGMTSSFLTPCPHEQKKLDQELAIENAKVVQNRFFSIAVCLLMLFIALFGFKLLAVIENIPRALNDFGHTFGLYRIWL